MSKIRNALIGGVAASTLSCASAGDYFTYSSQGAPAQPTTAQLKAANLANRQAIVQAALKKQQQIFSQTFAPTSGVVLNIQPRYAGLILGFYVDVSATLTLGTNNGIRTAFGAGNFIQQVQFQDLSNNTRHQTTGWHLNAIDSVKSRRPYQACMTINTDYPVGYGEVFTANIATAPATLTTAGATAHMLFYVPLSYSDVDLRGAMWANVVNATAQLQLTMATSAQAFVAHTADPTSAVYQYDATGATGVITSYTVTVHQVFYDQLPTDTKGNQLLPIIDLSTLYMLNNTTLSGMVTGADFPIPYTNFRSFLSTVVIYDNQTGGTYNAAGTDINYWNLQTANFTNIFKYPSWFPGVFARDAIGLDFPLGMYYFDSRKKPINTIQYGNQQLTLNPTGTVNTGAATLIGWEMFAITNTLVGAASLAGG
jgi:P3 major capsid protein